MQIEAWLFLSAIILEVILIVVDLIVWRVYSNSMAELKKEVQVYKSAYITTKDRVEQLACRLNVQSHILHVHDEYLAELYEKGASDVNRN